jgi:hypothetical protein
MVLFAWLLVTAPIYIAIFVAIYNYCSRTAEKKEKIGVQENVAVVSAPAVVPAAVVSEKKQENAQLPTDDELMVVISAAVNIYLRSHQLKTK